MNHVNRCLMTKAKKRMAAKAERLVAKVLGGTRLKGNQPFDVIAGNLAIEVKAIKRQAASRMKVHIEAEPYGNKARFVAESGLVPRLAVVIYDGVKPEVRMGELKQHCRPSSLTQISISQYI